MEYFGTYSVQWNMETRLADVHAVNRTQYGKIESLPKLEKGRHILST